MKKNNESINNRNNKYKKKRKSHFESKYIASNLGLDEKVLVEVETSSLVFYITLVLFSLSAILFPKTIIEFFSRGNKTYFLGLIFNILLFFSGIYMSLYFSSRKIYLTNKKIIGKWGIFRISSIHVNLNEIQLIEVYNYKAIEIDSKSKNYFFDFVKNGIDLKNVAIEQITEQINSATDEKILNSFSYSLKDNFSHDNQNIRMMQCKCCKEMISKESKFCIHCGEPIPENERSADLFVKGICFFLPPIGILLFLFNIGPFPKFAKQCLLSSIFMLFIILSIYLSLLSIR